MPGKRWLTVGLSPGIQKSLVFTRFTKGGINRSEKCYTDGAGKCVNLSRVLVQSGIEGVCLTLAGRENGEYFRALCRRDGIEIKTVETAGRVRTCVTLMEREGGVISEIVANEPEEITPEEEMRFIQAFEAFMKEDFGAVIIAGSRLPGFSGKIIPQMVRKVKEKGLLLIADYRGEDLRNSFISQDVRPDYVKINESEFFQSFGSSAEEGMREVSLRYNNCIIISRGAEPTWVSDQGRFFSMESGKIPVVNPIGCGDSMTAGLAGGILKGLSLEKAIEQGRDYAALNAQRVHPGWIKENRA